MSMCLAHIHTLICIAKYVSVTQTDQDVKLRCRSFLDTTFLSFFSAICIGIPEGMGRVLLSIRKYLEKFKLLKTYRHSVQKLGPT
jgi:hypothetical protein